MHSKLAFCSATERLQWHILLSLAAAQTFPVVMAMSSREGLLEADMVLDSYITTQNSLENLILSLD